MKWSDTAHGQLAMDAIQLSATGDHSAALVLLERALALRPNDPLLLVYHGRVLRTSGRREDALRSLRAAVGIDDKLSFAWNEMGMLFQSEKAFEKAAFCYAQSSQIVPTVEAFTMLANMQLAFDPKQAVKSADRALALDPNWEEALVIRRSAEEKLRKLSLEE